MYLRGLSAILGNNVSKDKEVKNVKKQRYSAYKARNSCNCRSSIDYSSSLLQETLGNNIY